MMNIFFITEANYSRRFTMSANNWLRFMKQKNYWSLIIQ